MKLPAPSALSVPLARGVVALPGGLAWLSGSRALVAADTHLAYEEVVGGALPLWSTDEIVALLLIAIGRMEAREIIFLGDVIHGSSMSEGAMRRIAQSLELLRERVQVTLVIGNHEGRSRGAAVLGAGCDCVERDGWLLVHGDRPTLEGRAAIIGHLHPSLHLSSFTTVQAFVACDQLVVVPALTPYSTGLDALSHEFASAVGAWIRSPGQLHVVAATPDRLYPFGSLQKLQALMEARPRPRNRYRRPRRLTAD